MNEGVTPGFQISSELPSAGTLTTWERAPQPDVTYGTMLQTWDPLTMYFRCSRERQREALLGVLEDPPSVSVVVMYTLRNPGVEVQDRATALLGRLPARTLRFAKIFPAGEDICRPLYANKVWETVITALGLAETDYREYCVEYLGQLRHSPNPVIRLSVIDALDALDED